MWGGVVCQASAVWKEGGMLQNCLDSPKREILRLESGQFPNKIHILQDRHNSPFNSPHLVAFPGLQHLLREAHQDCPESLSNPTDAQGINSGQVFHNTVTPAAQTFL